MTFYKQFDAIQAKLKGKLFKGKRVYLDAAGEYSALAGTLDEQEPFDQGLIAMALFGEAQCYQKADDKPRFIRTGMRAARLFIKSADFNYEISKTLRETWADPLADGLHCFRIVFDSLKADGKPNLAVLVMIEAGRAQQKFELWHYAASAFDEALTVCLKSGLSVALLFDCATFAINSYAQADRIDLALATATRVEDGVRIAPFLDQIGATYHTKREFEGIKILHATLLLMAFKHNEAKDFANASFEPAMAKFFVDMSDASRKNQPAVLDGLISEAAKQNYLTEIELGLMRRHTFLLAKSIEEAFQEMTS